MVNIIVNLGGENMGTIFMENPATGEKLGEIIETTAAEVDSAVIKARTAFAKWSDFTVRDRLTYMKRIEEYLIAEGESLAEGISADTGKPKVEAYVTEIFTVIDALKYYRKNAEKMLRGKRVSTPLSLFGHRSNITYKSIGVVAVISPWNYPYQLALIPVISALIAGNTVVLKPSEATAYTGILIEKTLEKGGFPEGVVQVVQGGRETGEALVDSKPDKIFFTGSVATGKRIMSKAAEHLIPIELELGGKDPMLVFEDANIERAVNGALWGGFSNSGQTCMAVERVYVQEKVFHEFVKLAVEKTRKLRQGPGGADIGSMTTKLQKKIVEEHIKDALEKGATLCIGGLPKEDNFIPPTILTNVSMDMRIMVEETFGPVLPIVSFKTEEEAITKANNSTFGLNASVWSRDMIKARRVASKLESGSVCINDVIVSVANMNLPFGGVKQSGMGRYHGREGLMTFTHVVSTLECSGRKNRELNWFPYNDRLLRLSKRLAKLF